MEPIRVFIGYDSREPVAFHVACHSIHRHATVPVSITPVMLSQLQATFNRQRDPKQSTDFSFSRFLVPYLCDYQGWAIFIDCDILCCRDINELYAQRDERFAVQVVKHLHVPQEGIKFLNEQQRRYDCKNWSSMMLFHNPRCKRLTPEYIHSASGLELHQFKWVNSWDEIGSLPAKWNHLVDYDAPKDISELGILHFTTGGPWFSNYRDCGYADEWRAELDRTIKPQ